MDKDKALKLALEFVENVHLGEWQGSTERQEEIVTAINKALAQPAQKPVAWLYEGEYSSGSYSGNYFAWNVTMNKHATNAARKVKPLYTIPPQRPWVGLEGEKIRYLWERATKPDRSTMAIVTSFAQAIEAALKSKNI